MFLIEDWECRENRKCKMGDSSRLTTEGSREQKRLGWNNLSALSWVRTDHYKWEKKKKILSSRYLKCGIGLTFLPDLGWIFWKLDKYTKKQSGNYVPFLKWAARLNSFVGRWRRRQPVTTWLKLKSRRERLHTRIQISGSHGNAKVGKLRTLGVVCIGFHSVRWVVIVLCRPCLTACHYGETQCFTMSQFIQKLCFHLQSSG